ncbi:hypothetical protein D9757_010897 [Collybiopsis confluens]|uniref:Polysaccharide lyase 14 domain-containing protein n=1 Tax=Collybiopsis confluens TaxID=2823264 RepID=A0A8H5GI94_9AGAR|nr:hypothetical protein D9757_010897 [Collybiopsis confluens]
MVLMASTYNLFLFTLGVSTMYISIASSAPVVSSSSKSYDSVYTHSNNLVSNPRADLDLDFDFDGTSDVQSQVSSSSVAFQPAPTTPSEALPFGFNGGDVEVIGSKIYAIPFGGPEEPPSEPQTSLTLTVTQVITAITESSSSETSGSVTFQSASTSTVTRVVTSTVSSSSAVSPTRASSPSTTTRASSSIWANPARMADLSSFNVTHFAGGKQNLKIVDASSNASIASSGSAASASTATVTPINRRSFENPNSDSSPNASNTSSNSSSPSSSPSDSYSFPSPSTPPPSLLQLFYPKDSINPAQKPQGGAEFYAHPIDLSRAQNVSLTYRVFFPADFEWVLGGKLPGLYGGKEGCSGGKDAQEMGCFSTRLMWRKDGAGELYLYAPKMQSPSLCADPHSVCDQSYGYSIGRGTFYFARGGWTEVSQTVVLNTPGKQDGVFWLDVNGTRVIGREDMDYRDVGEGDGIGSSAPSGSPSPSSSREKESTGNRGGTGEGGGLLGGLLGGILRRVLPSLEEVEEGPRRQTAFDRLFVPQSEPASSSSTDEGFASEVGFSGLFFSTFFGGHDKEWASPKDQYVWFKGFEIVVNG